MVPRPASPFLPLLDPTPRPADETSFDVRRLVVAGAGGRQILRALVPGACRFSCSFCPMASGRPQTGQGSVGRDLGRLARSYLTAYRRGWCDGLFLTAGIPADPVQGMARLLDLVSVVRVRYGYRGYLHAKAVPGATPGQLERLVRLVDRVSFNLEPACERARREEAGAGTVEVTAAEVAGPSSGLGERLRTAQRRAALHALPALLETGARQGWRGQAHRLREGGLLQRALFESTSGRAGRPAPGPARRPA